MSTNRDSDRSCEGFLEGCDCADCVVYRTEAAREFFVSRSVEEVFSEFSAGVFDCCLTTNDVEDDNSLHEFRDIHFQFGFCQCSGSCCCSDYGHSKDSCSCVFCVCHMTAWTTDTAEGVAS